MQVTIDFRAPELPPGSDPQALATQFTNELKTLEQADPTITVTDSKSPVPVGAAGMPELFHWLITYAQHVDYHQLAQHVGTIIQGLNILLKANNLWTKPAPNVEKQPNITITVQTEALTLPANREQVEHFLQRVRNLKASKKK